MIYSLQSINQLQSSKLTFITQVNQYKKSDHVIDFLHEIRIKVVAKTTNSFAHSRGHTFIKQASVEINIDYIERINHNVSSILQMDVIEP